MKKSSLMVLFLVITITSTAQIDTSYWQKGGMSTVNFSQVSLTNWSQGGESSLSLQSLLNVFAKYRKGKDVWDNTVDVAYGILQSGENPVRKNDDKLEFTSKYGRQVDSSKFFYSGLINFRSQLANGYNYPNDSIVASRFLAPAFVLFSLGVDYQPSQQLSLYLSPVTSKVTIVAYKPLSDIGAFGVDSGKAVRIERGAYFTLKYKRNVVENVTFSTRLDLFSNYAENPENVDVNWDVLITMKINKFLAASINTTLVYDDDVPVPIYKDIAGVKTQVGAGPRTQFKEVVGVGLSYKF